jgi:hypothetical protein
MVHFRQFDLPENTTLAPHGRLEFAEPSSVTSVPYDGRGPELMLTDDGFWSTQFYVDGLTLRAYGDPSRPVRFVIDRWAYGTEPATPEESVHADAAQCLFDVKCLDVNDARYTAAKAVAKLRIEYSNLITTCTGFLYKFPNDNTPAKNRMMTASHCYPYSTRPKSVTCTFLYERAQCTNPPGNESCTGTEVAGTTKFTYGTCCDWLVFRTNGTPGDTYGMLELKDEKDLTTSSDLYVPQHPGGRCKEYSEGKYIGKDDDDCIFRHKACTTENGASGSPVIDKSDYKVVGIVKGTIGNDFSATKASKPLKLVQSNERPFGPDTCGTVTVGDETNPCMVDSCIPEDSTGGSFVCNPTPVADGTPCDDGDPCTQNETCQQGSCVGAETCHFSCYETTSRRFGPIPVNLVDQFGTTDVSVRDRLNLCNPADKNGESPGVESSARHLVAYKLFEAVRFTPVRNITVVNQFGTLVVDAVRRARLLVPSTKSLTGTPPPPSSATGAFIDHFECYRVKRARGAARFSPRSVTLADQFGSSMVMVVKPAYLCNPVDKNNLSPGAETHTTHLMCYRVKSETPVNMSEVPIFVNNQFGPQTLSVEHRETLCLPSLKNPPSTTTSTTSTTTTTL